MSKWTLVVISLLSAIIGGLITGGIFLAIALKTNILVDSKTDIYGAGSGYKMLSDFQCRYGETKHILMNGVDDNFALGNKEPGRKSERLSHLPGHVANHPYQRDYDETGQDKVMSDYFEVPSNVTQGLFVTRIENKDHYGNDYIGFGNFLNVGPNHPLANYNSFGSWLNDFSKVPNWDSTPGQIFSARLKDIIFKGNDFEPDTYIERDFEGLLPYLKSQAKASIIEVLVADDTAVDFTGLAVCTAPAQVQGLTFTNLKSIQNKFENLQILVCDSEITAEPCNPVYGDTVCTESLPLACFRDTGEPAPEIDTNASKILREDILEFWGGGDIEFTEPVRGDQFQSLNDANQLCEAELGPGWRVLDYHDGGIKSVASLKSSNTPESRVWIDIKDQANGTCWSRDKTASSLLGAAE